MECIGFRLFYAAATQNCFVFLREILQDISLNTEFMHLGH